MTEIVVYGAGLSGTLMAHELLRLSRAANRSDCAAAAVRDAEDRRCSPAAALWASALPCPAAGESRL